MIYHLTQHQMAKFADFGLSRPRLAQLAATVTDKYGATPAEAWEFVITDLDCFMQTAEDRAEVRRITNTCREYGQYLDAMERLGASQIES